MHLVGVLSVQGESCEPGNTSRGLQAEGKVCIQVEAYLSPKAPKNTHVDMCSAENYTQGISFPSEQ